MSDMWTDVSARYAIYESPLRPAAADVAALVCALQPVLTQPAPLRVLILGVTPALHGLPWPDASELVAVDQTPAMIQHVWPGQPEQALLGSWTALPLPPASRDVVVGDGCLTILAWPDVVQKVIRETHKVLVPGGLLVLRLFTPKPDVGTKEQIVADLFAKKIPHSSELKWRLWSAMQTDSRAGVGVAEVRQAVLGSDSVSPPDPERLAERTGWSLADSALFYSSVRNDGRHWLPCVTEVRHLIASSGFAFVSETCADAPWGPYCPVLTFRRGDGG